MNVVGRQMSRSNSSSHHQRQYSDHLIDASSKWLQSSTSLSQVNAFSIFVLLIIIAESDYEVVLLYIYMCRISGSMEVEFRGREWAGTLWTLRRLWVQGPWAWEGMVTIKSHPPVSSAPACSIYIASIPSYCLRFALTFFIFCLQFYHVSLFFFFAKCMW